MRRTKFWKAMTKSRKRIVASLLVAGTVLGLAYLAAFGNDTPSVEGMTLEAARATVERSGLSPNIEGEPKSGAVCRQEPDPGERQFPGDPVTLHVGSSCRPKSKETATKTQQSKQTSTATEEPPTSESVDVDNASCRDLGLDDELDPNEYASKYAQALAAELPSGTLSERVQGTIAALVLVCQNKGPDHKPKDGVLAFTKAAINDSREKEEAEATGSDCILLLASGNKLCGEDAVAYCNAVRTRDQDVESMKICVDLITSDP